MKSNFDIEATKQSKKDNNRGKGEVPVHPLRPELALVPEGHVAQREAEQTILGSLR